MKKKLLVLAIGLLFLGSLAFFTFEVVHHEGGQFRQFQQYQTSVQSGAVEGGEP